MRSKFIILVVSLLLSGRAFSENSTSPFTLQNAVGTPFQVLKKLFENSTLAASPNDFDDLDHMGTQKCVFANAEDKMPTESYPPLRITVVTKGQPSMGPEFPGTPDVSKELVLRIDSFNAVDISKSIIRCQEIWAARIKVMSSHTDLIESVISDGSGCLKNFETAEFDFRKNAGLLSMKISQDIGLPQEELVYGYCYRE